MAEAATPTPVSTDDPRWDAWWLPFVTLVGLVLVSLWVFDKVREPGLLITGGTYGAGAEAHEAGEPHGAGKADHGATENGGSDHAAGVDMAADMTNEPGQATHDEPPGTLHSQPDSGTAVNVLSDELLNEPTAEPAAQMFERQLGDVTLRGAAGGVESRLLAFIESDREPCTQSDCWFTFDRLTFATGSANLDLARSEDQLANIEAIMVAYPTLELKLGGYTDNRGDEGFNVALSQQRADAVVAALVARGISADRLGAEGYGSQFPIASNDTAAGRAANRRVDVRVRKR